MHQNITCNNFWCPNLGMKHCHSRPAVIQGSDPNRNPLRFGSLPWMTADENDNAPYPTMNTEFYCMNSCDASDIKLCPLEVHCHLWVLHLAAFLVNGTIDGSRDGNCEQSCNFVTVELVLILKCNIDINLLVKLNFYYTILQYHSKWYSYKDFKSFRIYILKLFPITSGAPIINTTTISLFIVGLYYQY